MPEEAQPETQRADTSAWSCNPGWEHPAPVAGLGVVPSPWAAPSSLVLFEGSPPRLVWRLTHAHHLNSKINYVSPAGVAGTRDTKRARDRHDSTGSSGPGATGLDHTDKGTSCSITILQLLPSRPPLSQPRGREGGGDNLICWARAASVSSKERAEGPRSQPASARTSKVELPVVQETPVALAHVRQRSQCWCLFGPESFTGREGGQTREARRQRATELAPKSENRIHV